MKRTKVKHKQIFLSIGSTYDIYYSNGNVERVKLCCPHCKSDGFGQGNDWIRLDATRCPQCAGTFKEPEVISREQMGYNWIEQEAKEQEYQDSLIFGLEPWGWILICIILFLSFIGILMELS